MNELHIKYRSDTGENATYEAGSLQEEIDNGEHDFIPFPTKDYVSWLEEKLYAMSYKNNLK